jgi:TatD DNase family protein
VAEPAFPLVDSHCHIDMPQFDADRDEVVARAREAGLVEMLVVGGVDEEAGHRRALQVAESFGLPATAGLHPHEARIGSEAIYTELRALAGEGRIVGIGEIGLDFHYDHSPREAQRAAFRRQIRLAREVGLPIVVHTREADHETVEILEGEGAGETGGVVHCFTGGLELARRALELGFFISFSGIVAFPRAEVIQQVAREVPDDRLLIETDAPFLAPAPPPGEEERARLRGGRGAEGGGLAGRDGRGRRGPRPPQLRPPLPARRLTLSGFDNAPRIRHFTPGVAPCDASPPSQKQPWPTAPSTS